MGSFETLFTLADTELKREGNTAYDPDGTGKTLALSMVNESIDHLNALVQARAGSWAYGGTGWTGGATDSGAYVISPPAAMVGPPALILYDDEALPMVDVAQFWERCSGTLAWTECWTAIGDKLYFLVSDPTQITLRGWQKLPYYELDTGGGWVDPNPMQYLPPPVVSLPRYYLLSVWPVANDSAPEVARQQRNSQRWGQGMAELNYQLAARTGEAYRF